MNIYLENMIKNLSEDKTEMLKNIYAPTVVGVVPKEFKNK